MKFSENGILSLIILCNAFQAKREKSIKEIYHSVLSGLKIQKFNSDDIFKIKNFSLLGPEIPLSIVVIIRVNNTVNFTNCLDKLLRYELKWDFLAAWSS